MLLAIDYFRLTRRHVAPGAQAQRAIREIVVDKQTQIYGISIVTLSKKAIYSLKLALAVTLAYGVGLSMDWEQPRWAAITITLMALTTVGQSLNDAIERMFGTALAGFMIITLLALFSQDRWLYMFFLSA